ncbi:MFS transporter [Nonomuraea mangrovi]|uniref:MFS transporter n=1 Tax=Nonomuraea mangrovi TaxID=2316207 RepID=A0ABW4T5E7_9ACTN
MTSPRPLVSWRLLIFGLAAAALSGSLMFAGPSLSASTSGPHRLDLGVLSGVGGTLVSVLLGLPFGVLIDRVRRRRSVMVVMALLGTVAVASVTAADALGTPGGPHVIAIVTVTAALKAVAPVGQDAILPSVVGREHLIPANALLSVLPQALFLGLGLVLPSALERDEFAFLVIVTVAVAVAALLFRSVDVIEEPPPPRAGIWREMVEGIGFTVKQPVLRAIAVYLLASALFAELVDEVTGKALNAAIDVSAMNMPLGEYIWLSSMVSIYGVTLLGAVLAVLLHRRLGAFRLAWSAVLVSQPFTLLLALSGTGHGHIWYMIGRFVPLLGTIVAAIALLSHRQAITPDRLLGRVCGLLLVVTSLAGALGELLETPVEWFTDLNGSSSTPLALLPGPALATVVALAAAVPLLRARHLVAGTTPEPTAAR